MNMNDMGVHNLEKIVLLQWVGRWYGSQYIALTRAYNAVRQALTWMGGYQGKAALYQGHLSISHRLLGLTKC